MEELVLSTIDKIMKDCAKGKFNNYTAIIKINNLTNKYTDWKSVSITKETLDQEIKQRLEEIDDLHNQFTNITIKTEELYDILNKNITTY